ncbi:MAG: transposase [Alphaproteobacteria bacterium]|nr:transposase [Alphaproteobacteria bacterium]
MTRTPWRSGHTAAGFPSTRRCASRPPTTRGGSACCATRARPPFALDRLRALDPERLLYDGAKPGPGGSGPLRLTPLQRIDRLAALVPPPRVHRHRYYGVLAPNSPLRDAVTAMASPTVPLAAVAPPAAELIHRRAARYAWALLLARIYEVFPLRCPKCGTKLRTV